MRFLIFPLLGLVFASAPGGLAAPPTLREYAAREWPALEQSGAGALAGVDGWLFLSTELRLLSAGDFWGGNASKMARATRPELADPGPAILDFQAQLRARGIELLLVPVPPKAAIVPGKLATELAGAPDDPMATLRRFYAVLREGGVEVLDLSTAWPKDGETPADGAVFCRTDTHWSGAGCVLAAKAIAARVAKSLPATEKAGAYRGTWEEREIQGDLGTLLAAGTAPPAPERLRVRSVALEGSGKAVDTDPASPLLLLGDSHTLVFHDFQGERAGLPDQLALELGFAPDLLGTRGSGATPVRISLYRRSVKDPGYLARKKVVVWCFTAREFTEAAEGWPKIPVGK